MLNAKILFSNLASLQCNLFKIFSDSILLLASQYIRYRDWKKEIMITGNDSHNSLKQ